MVRIKPGTLVQVVPETEWKEHLATTNEKATHTHGWLYTTLDSGDWSILAGQGLYQCRSVASGENIGWLDFELEAADDTGS